MADRFERQLRDIHGDELVIEEMEPAPGATGRRYRVVKRDAVREWAEKQPPLIQLGAFILAIIALVACLVGLVLSIGLVGFGLLAIWSVLFGH